MASLWASALVCQLQVEVRRGKQDKVLPRFTRVPCAFVRSFARSYAPSKTNQPAASCLVGQFFLSATGTGKRNFPQFSSARVVQCDRKIDLRTVSFAPQTGRFSQAKAANERTNESKQPNQPAPSRENRNAPQQRRNSVEIQRWRRLLDDWLVLRCGCCLWSGLYGGKGYPVVDEEQKQEQQQKQKEMRNM